MFRQVRSLLMTKLANDCSWPETAPKAVDLDRPFQIGAG